MEPHTIFFVGKPGSGKGTQAKFLSDATGWPTVTASDGLREVISGGGVIGRKTKETMDTGLLVPHWLVSYIYLKTLFAVPEDGSIIFDGTGRTLPEAQIVLDSVRWLERPFIFFHLGVPDDDVRQRIELRKATSGRADDHVFDKRLEAYYADTDPAIDYYRQAGVLTEIDGTPKPEVIAADIRSRLGIA